LNNRWNIQNDIINARLCVDRYDTDLSYVYPSRTYKAQKISTSSWRNQVETYAKLNYKQDGFSIFYMNKMLKVYWRNFRKLRW